ncbi:glycine-rich domain-containing protein [Algoriphagus sp. A40]|uniref:glycine-rich domain-containing protein n=1 Tax=Algoriphagus sp. A40 TaxID=1945863 RepID=UPI0011155B3E|nr:PKD-like domain-containing protein [Algoriphagus sp. A40]
MASGETSGRQNSQDLSNNSGGSSLLKRAVAGFLVFGVVFFLIGITESFGQSQIFNASGNFPVPHKITNVQLDIWGAGGGGGFINSRRPAAGGGGGAFARYNSFGVTPNATIAVTVGTGGNGQTSTSASTNGGPSTFGGTISVNGGIRGNGNTPGAGGVAGTGGNINSAGGPSVPASSSNDRGGSGGGAAGSSTGIGASGLTSGTGPAGGAGGTGVNGAGSGGNGGADDAVGVNGSPPGGGGGGEGGQGTSGGAGGNGRVIVTWACSTTLTSGAGTNNPTVCQGTGIGPITFVIAGGYGATVTGLPTGVTASYVDGDLTISGNPTTSGSFTYTITPTGSCTTTTATGTITVTPNNTAGTISSNTFCANSPLPGGVIQSTTGATGIDAAGATDLPPGVTVSWASNQITFAGTPNTEGTYSYSIPMTGGCGVVNATGTITVTGNNTAGTISSNTFCINSALPAGVTQSTTVATGINAGGATGLPPGVIVAWASNQITFTGTPTTAGTFNYSIPLTGGCGAVNATGTITITPSNTATPDAGADRTLCINTALPAGFTFTTTGATGISNPGVSGANGLPLGVSASWASNTITISGTPTASGTFNYSIPLTGGCGTVNATGTITVTANNSATPTAGTDRTVCINTALPVGFTFTTTGAIGISNPGVSGANGLPAGVSANWASNTLTISGTPTSSGTFNYSIPLIDGGCGPAVNAIGTITVSPNNTTGTITFNTFCINSALPVGVAQSTTGATGINAGGATGLPPGISVAWASNQITFTGIPTTSGTFNYSIPLTGGCGPGNAIGTITITPNNTVIPNAGANRTLCINSALAAGFTFTTTGATGISNPGVSGANGLPAGVSASWTSNTITISGTPTASGTFNYSIPLTGGCGAINATGTITVDPIPTADPGPALFSICQAGTSAVMGGSFGGGATGGTWSGGAGTWTNANDPANATYTASASESGNVLLTLTTTGGSCTPIQVTKFITVNANPIINVGAALPAICQGATSIAMGGSVSGGATTGTWSGGAGTWTNANDPATATYTAGASESGAITLFLTASNGTCVSSSTKTITVNPNPVINVGPAITAICQGQQSAAMGGSVTAGASALWTGGAGTWTNADNATTARYTAGTSESGVITLTLTSTLGSCTVFATKTITVNPNPTVSAGTAFTSPICQGQPSPAMGGSVGPGGATGLWTGGAGTWTNANNPATATYTAGTSESGTITLTLTATLGTCTAVTTKTITVNQLPSVTATPASQFRCDNIGSGTIITLSNAPINLAGTTYEWTRTNPAGLVGTGAGTALSGTTSGTTLVGTYKNNTTANITTTYTITPVGPAPTFCRGVPVNVTVTIYAPLVAPVISDDQGVCVGGVPNSLNGTSATGGSGSYSYQWQSRTSPTGWSATDNIAGATGLTYQPPAVGLFDPTIYYRLVVTDNICGNALPSNVITVENILSFGNLATTTLSNTPSTTPFCPGGTFSSSGSPISISTANHASFLSYRYILSYDPNFITPASTGQIIGTTVSSGFLATTTANLPQFTVTNTTNTTVTTTIEVIPIAYLGSTERCNITSVSFPVTIRPTPVLTATPASPTICSGSGTAITLTSNITDNPTTYTWTASQISGPIGSITFGPGPTSGSGPINQTLTNTGTVPAVVRYIITPSSMGCTGASRTVDITVTPTNTITRTSAPATTNQTVCSGVAITTITYATTGATGATVSGLPTGVTGVWSGNVVTISGTPNVPAGGTFTYTVNMTGGCTSSQSAPTGSIIVNPIHTITAGSDRTVCLNAPMTAITLTLGGGATGATVTGLPAGVIAGVTGTTLTISGTPTAIGPFTYTVTTTGNACATASTTGIITVNPIHTITAGSDQTVCQNASMTPITLTLGGGATGATVTGLPAGVTSSVSGSTLTISGTPTATGPFTYTVTTTGNGCTVATTGGTLTVTPIHAITAGSNRTVCQNAPMTAITMTLAGGATGATVTGLPAGVTASVSGTTLTISGTPTVSGPFNFTVTTTGNACTAATTTGTITVNPIHTITAGSDQTVCQNAAMTPITMTLGGGATGATVSGLPAGVTASVSGTTLTISGTPSVSGPFTYTVTTTGSACATATTSGTITVNPIHTITAASNQTVCLNAAMTAITMTLGGGATGATVTGLPAGVTASVSGTTLTISGTPTTLGSFTYTVITTGNSCATATTGGTITVDPNHTITAGSDQTVCQNAAISPITMTLGGGATGATVTGLPTGVTHSVLGTTLTISGTPTVSGTFNYTVTTIGNSCIPATTGGTITVSNPNYPITDIDVVNPLAGSPPYTSTFTVYSGGFTTGTYTVVYNSSGVIQATNQTTTASVSTNGILTFNSQPYSNEGTSILTIVSIRNNADNCTYFPPTNTSVPYGVNCSTEYLEANGDEIFYVPTGITQVTIQAFGDGSSSSAETMTVVPGGAIFVVFDGSDVFATEVPASEPISDRIDGAIVHATGPNGRIVFSFACNPLPPCSTQLDNGSNYIDSEGFTVVRFSFEGPCTWDAPDGLEEFEVLVVGGGGGGGFGTAAGGGGGGAVVYEQYTGITMGGETGLQNATFTLSIGNRGLGANSGVKGGNGLASTFTGPLFDYTGPNVFDPLIAEGGGGGGSSNTNLTIRQGENGLGDASGGGGAAYQTNASSGGSSSGVGNSGGTAYSDAFGTSGAGGGGVNGPGANGSSSGGGTQMNGGNGGSGRQLSISGEDIFYGAGGGGTSSGAISNIEGLGGSQYTVNSITYFAGGSGTNSGEGKSATTFGSGGGAGGSRGGDGFPGVVYIRYPNYRILAVEYLYFNAKYNPGFRSGDLTWATAKEWENDRFEIERSVNDVKSWETIGQVNGAGYSDAPIDYSYQDMKLPLAGGNIFYRLKQVDFDGDSTYSDTKAIQVEAMPGTTYWRVYPNPTTGDPINLEMLDTGAYNDEEITVRVISATGQFETLQGSSATLLSSQLSEILRTKAAGIYTLEISWGNFKEYHKVILRR